jgi:histidinol-phosphate aminotransferase
MSLSRRSFLGTLGAGAAAAAVAPSIPYLAFGEPPRRPRPDSLIILDSNENAYGMFPSAERAANEAVHGGNRYPAEMPLVEKLAAYHKVPVARVMTGYGSSEILAAAVHAFTGPNRKLLQAAPTFELPAHHARAQGTAVVSTPLTSSYAHDLGAMLSAAGSDTGLVYVCNPNNPTASLTPRRDIESFLAKLPASAYVLIDEAYHHFAGGSADYVSFLEKPVDDPRVIVARTFSKVYGMAGMRLGYAVAAEPAIQAMQAWQLANNGNVVALAAALTALDDDAALRAAVARNAADRAEFIHQAESRKLRPIPSYANFVMMETGRPVRGLIMHFRDHNVSIGRPFPPMENFARVSLGRPQEMAEFWRVWDMLPSLAKQ